MGIWLKLKILIISLVLCVKVRYAIFDTYLKFLNLNLVPYCLQRTSFGDALFTRLGGPNVLRSSEIMVVWLFERFWREHDRQEDRHVFGWFFILGFVNTWGENAIKTWLILTISFWGLSESCVFWRSKTPFWDLNFGSLDAQICYKLLRIFDYFSIANSLLFGWYLREV